MVRTGKLFAALVVSSIVAVGCSDGVTDGGQAANQIATGDGAQESSSAESASDSPTDSPADSGASGIRLVSPSEGVSIQANPPDDLVILDVRTPEEFNEGHLDGAIMIDFYRDDFADQLKDLDRDVPYLLYCRSGNRSGRTAALMEGLGFTDVADVDGGILSWLDAGLPVSTG